MDQQAHSGSGVAVPRAAAPPAERTLRQLLSDPPHGHQRLDCSAIVRRLTSHPREAAALCDIGRSTYPLHRVLDLGKTHRLDVAVVRAFLDAYREAAFCPNNRGHVPLHYASGIPHPGVAEKIVRMVLDEYPNEARRRSRRGAVPLHFASSREVARVLLDEYPQGVGVQSGNGMLPLHNAVSAAESSGLVGLLLEEGKKQGVGGVNGGGGVFVKDYHGDNPLVYVSKVLRGEVNLGCFDDGGSPVPLSKKGTCHWRILEALVCAASSTLITKDKEEIYHLSNGKFCFLHALIEFRLHRDIIQRVIRTSPEQLQQRDRYGRLPLAVALSCRTKSHFVFQNSDEWISDVIDMLLDPDHGFGGAAEMVDGDGRMALHLAVESGWKFRYCVQKILRASPRSLDARDVKTGMYPFMMAAIGPVAYLDVVFELLLANPELVRGTNST